MRSGDAKYKMLRSRKLRLKGDRSTAGDEREGGCDGMSADTK